MTMRISQSGGQASVGLSSDSNEVTAHSIQRNRLDFFGTVDNGDPAVPGVMPGLEQAASRYRTQAVPSRVAGDSDFSFDIDLDLSLDPSFDHADPADKSDGKGDGDKDREMTGTVTATIGVVGGVPYGEISYSKPVGGCSLVGAGSEGGSIDSGDSGDSDVGDPP